MHDLPCVLVPGGSTLPPTEGEDLGKVQTIGARYANNELSLEDASRLGCRACGSAGGGCQFLGTAGTSQVVAEGLGLALPHTALAPSGEPVWVEVGRQSAKAVLALLKKGITIKDIVTDKAIENAMRFSADWLTGWIKLFFGALAPRQREQAQPRARSAQIGAGPRCRQGGGPPAGRDAKQQM